MISNAPSVNRTDSPLPALSTMRALPCERVDYWRDVVCEKILPLDITTPNSAGFNASLECSQFDELSISTIHASPHTAERGLSAIKRGGSESLVFNFVVAGSGESVQDGRHAYLVQGSGTFVNAARPYTLNFREPVSLLVLQLPRDLVTASVSGSDLLASRDLDRGSQLFPLVMSYVSQLAARDYRLEADTGRRVSRNLADLVSAMLAESVGQCQSRPSDSKIAVLLRVRAFVEQHLSDPALDPNMVSQALRLSPRYINQLLSADGTSLCKWIWQRRLELVAADLANPAISTRTISTIALARGFSDLSHFSKAFRRQFSMSPRDFRMGMVDRRIETVV